MSSPLWAVLPGGIDDPAAPSGGNRYDRSVLAILSGSGSGSGEADPDHSLPNFMEMGPSNHDPHSSPPDSKETGPAGVGEGPTSGKSAGTGRGDTPPAARDVHEIAINGSWPTPNSATRAALSAALADIPDKSDVLLDGLVACGVPEILEPHCRRLRLVVLVHLPLSDETGLPPGDAAVLRERERRTLHLADAVIATSAAAAERIITMHGLPTVAVAAPGVDPAPPTEPAPDGRRLLCVASVTPRKGQDLLVRVLEEDLADLGWTCTFAGALAHPVTHSHERIRFAGPLVGDALDEAYALADLFVLPSRAETYGMVVTEALARGLPVIATAVGGVPEALGRAPDGSVPGLLIPPDDPVALAAALRAWLTDPGLRKSWLAAARARRDTLSTWTDTARRLAAILDHTDPAAATQDRATAPPDATQAREVAATRAELDAVEGEHA